MNKQRKIIIGVLALAVTIIIGYALFSENIAVNGTAKAEGIFDIKITNASITKEVGSSGATVTVNNDGNSLTITVPHLEYPGAYVDVSFDIKNNGSIPALYNGVDVQGIDKNLTRGSTNAIRLSGTIDDFYYEPNVTHNETVKIFWKNNINKTEEESATATITLNYIQVNDKNDACEKITELTTNIRDCISSSSTCYNKELLDFDLNGLYNSSDGSFVNKAKSNICTVATTS